MELSNDIEQLKKLILEKEVISNLLVCTGNNYHIVTASVIDFYNDEYTFYFDGYGFNLELDEIKSFCVLP